MVDYGIYWKNFADDCRRDDWPTLRWLTSRDALARRLANGDRVWLFTSGQGCGMSERNAGYLVQVSEVQEVLTNTGGNPDYPTDEFKYAIVFKSECTWKIEPPALADELIRPEARDISMPIGRVRQGPWRLDEGVVARLQDLRTLAQL